MNKNTSGIYCIENIANSKKYIGQSVNVYKRFREHKSNLSKNKHPNKHLQYSFNKYGIENFTFNIIELCDIDCLDGRECYYISLYKTCDDQYGYNLDSGGNKNKKLSEQTKQKISDANKGEKNAFYGKTHSEESRKKMSESSKGFKHSDESKRKMSEHRTGKNNAFYGKTHSEETKQKIGDANNGGNNARSKRVYCPELNTVFGSAREAGRETGVNRRSISYCATGTQKFAGKHPDTGEKLHWIYIDEEMENDIC